MAAVNDRGLMPIGLGVQIIGVGLSAFVSMGLGQASVAQQSVFFPAPPEVVLIDAHGMPVDGDYALVLDPISADLAKAYVNPPASPPAVTLALPENRISQWQFRAGYRWFNMRYDILTNLDQISPTSAWVPISRLDWAASAPTLGAELSTDRAKPWRLRAADLWVAPGMLAEVEPMVDRDWLPVPFDSSNPIYPDFGAPAAWTHRTVSDNTTLRFAAGGDVRVTNPFVPDHPLVDEGALRPYWGAGVRAEFASWDARGARGLYSTDEFRDTPVYSGPNVLGITAHQLSLAEYLTLGIGGGDQTLSLDANVHVGLSSSLLRDIHHLRDKETNGLGLGLQWGAEAKARLGLGAASALELGVGYDGSYHYGLFRHDYYQRDHDGSEADPGQNFLTGGLAQNSSRIDLYNNAYNVRASLVLSF